MAKKRGECIPVRRAAGRVRKPKPVMAWGGFVDGNLCEWMSGFYDVEHLSVSRTRADAKRCCEDVRRVEIRILS